MTVKIILNPWLDEYPGRKWRYTLSSSGVFEFIGVVAPDCTIRHNERLLGFVKDNRLTIMSGYAWNGMSFYPETDDNQIDSLIHDFLYQTGLLPRKEADLILKNMSSLHDKKHSLIYAGVRLFGGLFYAKDKNIRISYESLATA